MTGTRLEGPHRLIVDDIDAVIAGRSAGTFAIGHLDYKGRFVVQYVGRSDNDLRSQLKSKIGAEPYFKHLCFETARQAFEKECELFHAFQPPGNFLHPERPAGTDWKCPHCMSMSFRR